MMRILQVMFRHAYVEKILFIYGLHVIELILFLVLGLGVLSKGQTLETSTDVTFPLKNQDATKLLVWRLNKGAA